MAKKKPKAPVPLTVRAKEYVVTVTQLPVEISAPPAPAGGIYNWETPDGFKSTRKINHTLIITAAPNGTHTIGVTVFTSKPPAVNQGEVTIMVDVKSPPVAPPEPPAKPDN